MATSPVLLRGRRARAASPDTPPASGPLVDRFGRVHRDLRLSLTDRCNLRCSYCLPAQGVRFQKAAEHLSASELERVAGVARGLGIERLRLTGGEPLVRSDVVQIVSRLAGLGFSEVAMTTNAMRLGALAGPLAEAGLDRVNVSCDSLDPARFSTIRRRGHLPTVLAAMDAAEAAGLGPVKVNVVPIAGVNDDEIEAFAAFARATGRPVRFIEFMPLDADGAWRRDRVVAADEILSRVSRRWPLDAVAEPAPAPATRYRFRDGLGEIGVVASVTRPFCGTCDRLRVTADGAIRNCLFTHEEHSVRDLLRAGRGDPDLVQMFRRAVWEKRPGHGIDEPGFLSPARSMSMIGG